MHAFQGSVRVVLVNDQPLFARGLELLLPAVSQSRVSVVGVTDDGSLASGLVRRHLPDVAVVDLGIPEPGGVRTIAAIRRTEPHVAVVAMSDRATREDDDGTVASMADRASEAVEAMRAGASGFLCKTSEPEELVMPLLTAVAGWAVVPRDVLDHLLAARPAAVADSALSTAESRLWRLIAQGHSAADIARQLHVSERTAKRLTASLLQRLHVRTRLEAAALAGRSGLLGH